MAPARISMVRPTMTIALAVAAITLSSVHAEDDTFSCLVRPTDVTIEGDQAYRIYDTRGRDWPGDTIFDARRGVFWNQRFPRNFEHSSIVLSADGRTAAKRGCWAGGLIVGTNDLNAAAVEMHSDVGLKFSNRNFTIDGVRIHNVGDGIRVSGQYPSEGTEFVIRNS